MIFGLVILFVIVMLVVVHHDTNASGYKEDKDKRPYWEREKHNRQETFEERKYNRVLDGRNSDMGRK